MLNITKRIIYRFIDFKMKSRSRGALFDKSLICNDNKKEKKLADWHYDISKQYNSMIVYEDHTRCKLLSNRYCRQREKGGGRRGGCGRIVINAGSSDSVFVVQTGSILNT